MTPGNRERDGLERELIMSVSNMRTGVRSSEKE